jgi:hypothetical protein
MFYHLKVNLFFMAVAVAQDVSRWLPTAAARVRSEVMWDLW